MIGRSGGRPLSDGETKLARSVFGDAIDYARVRVHNRRWFPFQPKRTVMAPDGHLWFHPGGALFCDDFCATPLIRQGLFIHEMTHVWQHQKGICLPLQRHPFCRYDYSLKPAWSLEKYGLEQQAEIVKHAFWLRNGVKVAGIADPAAYDLLVRFPGAER